MRTSAWRALYLLVSIGGILCIEALVLHGRHSADSNPYVLPCLVGIVLSMLVFRKENWRAPLGAWMLLYIGFVSLAEPCVRLLLRIGVVNEQTTGATDALVRHMSRVDSPEASIAATVLTIATFLITAAVLWRSENRQGQ